LAPRHSPQRRADQVKLVLPQRVVFTSASPLARLPVAENLPLIVIGPFSEVSSPYSMLENARIAKWKRPDRLRTGISWSEVVPVAPTHEKRNPTSDIDRLPTCRKIRWCWLVLPLNVPCLGAAATATGIATSSMAAAVEQAIRRLKVWSL
jgi:hypothetical protein